jgi:hypothetical protein
MDHNPSGGSCATQAEGVAGKAGKAEREVDIPARRGGQDLDGVYVLTYWQHGKMADPRKVIDHSLDCQSHNHAPPGDVIQFGPSEFINQLGTPN